MYARPARWARVRTSLQASAPQSSSAPVPAPAGLPAGPPGLRRGQRHRSGGQPSRRRTRGVRRASLVTAVTRGSSRPPELTRAPPPASGRPSPVITEGYSARRAPCSPMGADGPYSGCPLTHYPMSPSSDVPTVRRPSYQLSGSPGRTLPSPRVRPLFRGRSGSDVVLAAEGQHSSPTRNGRVAIHAGLAGTRLSAGRHLRRQPAPTSRFTRKPPAASNCACCTTTARRPRSNCARPTPSSGTPTCPG